MMIHINTKDVRFQHQYLFDLLWEKAIPSNQKMKEIEEDMKEYLNEIFAEIKKGNIDWSFKTRNH